jgi:hypothetical protein
VIDGLTSVVGVDVSLRFRREAGSLGFFDERGEKIDRHREVLELARNVGSYKEDDEADEPASGLFLNQTEAMHAMRKKMDICGNARSVGACANDLSTVIDVSQKAFRSRDWRRSSTGPQGLFCLFAVVDVF